MNQTSPKEVANAIITNISDMEQRRARNADFAHDVEPLIIAGWEVASGLASKRVTPDVPVYVMRHEQGGYKLWGNWTMPPSNSVKLDTVPEILAFMAEVEAELASVGV
ncbi:MAG: hypothetical protein OXF79_22080 [Chloroflexi bacterium]|nr:hypothetical protein [Chloroflexota bacterium]